jgi:acetylornithine/N-succinyldiaminopimelate aminotransferase
MAVEGAIGDETAGILIEPIMGEGGMREVSWRFLQDLRALADEKGIILLLDEVQTGIGRTGRLYAHEWAGIEPDILATAKGLGGGFPVGACLTTEAMGAAMTAGSHGSTFGGNPLAMAVGNAVLDVVLEDGFLDRVAQMGLRLKQRLAALKDDHGDIIEEVRGQGLMLGLKCKVPNQDLLEALRAQKMLTVQAGDNVVRPCRRSSSARPRRARRYQARAACAAIAKASAQAWPELKNKSMPPKYFLDIDALTQDFAV